MEQDDEHIDRTIIKLNVGGTEILTYKGNFLKYRWSRLYNLISRAPKESMMPNDPTTYFIDYSIDRFEYVLDFLRNGQWPQFYSASGAQNFKTDLAHFGLLPFMCEPPNEANKEEMKAPLSKRKKKDK